MDRRALPAGAHVAPSILSADFSRLREQVGEVLAAGARVIHVDVMDGHFVPPITLGPLVVDALREQAQEAGAALDVHLMIERPERQVAEFARAGADSITFHIEATAHAARVAELIREHGVAAGVALNPGTSVAVLGELVRMVDLVLCMTVNPGWGGQDLIPGSQGKIARLRGVLDGVGVKGDGDRAEGAGADGIEGAGTEGVDKDDGGEVVLEVDGGIDVDTAPSCREAGASLFVAGSAIFGESDPARAYRAIVESLGDG